MHEKEVQTTRTVVMGNETSHCPLDAWKQPSQNSCSGFTLLDS